MKKKLFILCGILCILLAIAAVGCNEGPQGNQSTTDPNGSEEPSENPSDDPSQTPSDTFTVTLVFDETIGTVTLSPEAKDNAYAVGTSVTATVEPLPGRKLSSFKADGEEKSPVGGKYTFTVEKDVTLEAVFVTVPMPASVYESLLGQTAYTGNGSDSRVYDGNDNYPISFSYDFEVAFDGDLVRHTQYERSYNIYLHNRVYKNENGKAVSYSRNLDNTFTISDMGTDFSEYSNPFEELSPEDFIGTGDGGFTLTDAEKAQAAAFAFTGAKEDIANFTVFENEGKVSFIQIDSVVNARGEGFTLNYTYTSHYAFDIAEPMDLGERITPYPTSAAHASLKNALEAAERAKSYTYHVKEDAEYDCFVTEDAIYQNEGDGNDLGYYLHSDGKLHEIYLEEGKLTIGDVAMTVDENLQTVPATDLDGFKPHFTFAAELFEAKGNGVFELRTVETNIVREVAQILWNFNDPITMAYAYSVRITVKNDVIEKVEIGTMIWSFKTVFELTYSDWDMTKLPYLLDTAEGGTADPDTPAVEYPETFCGTYEGDDTDSQFKSHHYVVVIGKDTITASVDGEDIPITVTGYDKRHNELQITFDGTACYLSLDTDNDGNVLSISIMADNFSVNLTLPCKTEGGAGGEEKGVEKFYGTYEGTYFDVVYRVTIAENSVTVTIDGVAAEVEYVGYDEKNDVIQIVLNGKNYEIAYYFDDNENGDAINLSGPNWSDPSPTLSPVSD